MANTIVTLSGEDADLYKAFQRIIDQQNRTDAGYRKVKDASKEAANAAKQAAKDAEAAERSRKATIDGMFGSITQMATGYMSVATAVGVVTTAHQELISNQKAALDKAKELAAAQQEAAKNLAGKTPAQISETLQKTVPEIAKATDFKDVNALTTALGSASSIVGEDMAKDVVKTSAQLTRFTPGELQKTATATSDIMKATGLQDSRQGMAMLASAGSVARPEQLAKLATGAAVAINASTSMSPQQDRVAAAKEGVALYATVSKVDPEGQSAGTATVQFMKQIADIFSDPKLQRERADKITALEAARPENTLAVERAQLRVDETKQKASFFQPGDSSLVARDAALDAQKAELDLAAARAKAAKDAEDLDKLQAQQRALKSGMSDEQRATAQSTIAIREKAIEGWKQDIAAGTVGLNDYGREYMTANKMDPEKPEDRLKYAALQLQVNEADLAKLQKEFAAADKVPDTFQSRLQRIRDTPELNQQVQETLTGEAKFLPLFRELLDSQSTTSKELQTAQATVTTDVKAFDQVAQSTVETPQAKIVQAGMRADTAANIQQSYDAVGQVRSSIYETTNTALKLSAKDFLSGASNIVNYSATGLAATGGSDNRTGIAQQQMLQDRLVYLGNQRASPETIDTVVQALAAIQTLARLPEILEQVSKDGSSTQEFLKRQNELADETNRILNQLEKKGLYEPSPPPNPQAIRNQVEVNK